MKTCNICPNKCPIVLESICGRRPNLNKSIVETTSIAIDPIEKKPLYHYKPGSKTLSIGTLGCNLKCLNCQNHSIAQPEDLSLVPTRNYSPHDIVSIALNEDIDSISWTYNEPTIYPEWIINTATIAKEYDISTIVVTNGYTSYDTLKEMVKYVDAVNIDLKSIQESFYRNVCRAKLEPIKRSIEYYYENSVHVELTNLIIPGYNDDKNSISKLSKYVNSISSNIPIHFSAFYPQFKLSHVKATQEETIFNACNIARKIGLKYVYPGNTHPSYDDNTYCKKCDEIIIERDYYNVKVNLTTDNRCPNCNSSVNYIKR